MQINLKQPPALAAILQDTAALGFTMASDLLTGSLLRTLAASKPHGRFLELGTGTGLSTAWILDGMDAQSTLLTVDDNPAVTAVAQRHLGHDPRLTLRTMDGIQLLNEIQQEQFSFIFADTWPGKYERLDLALNVLKVGGLYIVDDMLPQPNWPPDHPPKVELLLRTFETLENFRVTPMDWSTGLVVLVKTSEA
jgi:predicted O-methyltransferase YrrM